jgi:hypothetical protein
MRSSNRWAWVWGLALGLASPAWAGGGGGVTLEGAYYPRYGKFPGQYDAPGTLGCVGGMGFGTSQSGFRLGGEASFCRGREGVAMNRGGLQMGVRTKGRALYLTGYTGLGVGVLRDTTPTSGTYTAAFVYLRPTLALGIPSRIGSLEVGVSAMAPINVAQWVKAGESRGIVHATVGTHVSFLFGSFRDRRSRTAAASPAPATSPTPVDDARPLAIPGGAPPPLDAPPAASAGTTVTTTVTTVTTAPVVPSSPVPLAVPVWETPAAPVEAPAPPAVQAAPAVQVVIVPPAGVEESEAPEAAPARADDGSQK